ncbi:hypothetical protein ACRALDRAFT_1059326, partial [Sodiomyces alcalophilus JCM 7366]|uniref:uncharacterized protein n=1 Tax=Sodiomyces alcalophilus JCM 7366 TaxID=591952 RepID=UPI0039B5AE24
MLKEYGIRTGRHATVSQIRELRNTIQREDGSRRPTFDILISRKHCSLCLAYVQRLGRV